MALPATMRVLGLPLGLLAIVAMGAISELSIEMLVLFSTHFRVWSYGETVQAACRRGGGGGGGGGRRIAEICIMVNNAGILIVYLIIIGEVLSGSRDGEHEGLLQQLFLSNSSSNSTSTSISNSTSSSSFGSSNSSSNSSNSSNSHSHSHSHGSWWGNDRSLTSFLATALVLAPLCLLRRIDSLAVSSAISVLLAILFVCVSVGIAAAKLLAGTLESRPRMLPEPSSALDLLVVVPIMTNAYICHFNVHPIYAELRDPTPHAMARIGRISTALCVVIYAATAISGYLLFGDSTASDVLTNFDRDLGVPFSALLNAVVRSGYVAHLMLVFPVIHFSLRQTLDSFLFTRSPPGEDRRRLVWITASILAFVFLGSAFVPNIWVAFQFTGATTGLALGFLFPAIVGIRHSHVLDLGPRSRKMLYIGSWSMLVMAVSVSAIGIVGNILSLVKG
jgi:amino acid permease